MIDDLVSVNSAVLICGSFLVAIFVDFPHNMIPYANGERFADSVISL